MAEADWAQLRAFRTLVAQQARLMLPGYHPHILPHPPCPAGLSTTTFYHCLLLVPLLILLPTTVYCYACQARRQTYATSRPPFANPNPNTQARRQTADGRPPFVLPLAECSLDHEARALDGESMGDWMGRHGNPGPSPSPSPDVIRTLSLTPTLTLALTRPLECGAALVRRVRDAR